MLIDGKKIRDEIKEFLKGEFFNHSKKLTIISVGDDNVKNKFTDLKKKFGEEIGVSVEVKKYETEILEDVLIDEIKKADEYSDAVVVQLPLPRNINTSRVLDCVSVEKDIDMLSSEAFKKFLRKETKRMPPVPGAISEIFGRNGVDIKDKKVVIVGKGKLVGKPVFLWLMSRGMMPVIIDERDDLCLSIKDADIIISGAGSPHLIKKDMVKEGVVLIDVGTSSDKGVLRGDIDPECVQVASLFSAAPGGVGPITVAKLFENMALE